MAKKLQFVLKNIKVEKVEEKYGVVIDNELSEDVETPKNSTKISDIIIETTLPSSVSFMDELKRFHKCEVSTIDMKHKTDVKNLKYNCFWCRHSFETPPIGCPIKYISNQTIKTYYSEISKDVYTIKSNITKKSIKIYGV